MMKRLLLISATVILSVTLLWLTISRVPATPGMFLAQIKSASQLKDVQTSDYYFQSLQSLIERYGVNVAYPDGTFKAYLPMTRGDFAVFLNSSLDTLNRTIAVETTDLGTQEELAKLQRLADNLEAEVKLLKQSSQAPNEHL